MTPSTRDTQTNPHEAQVTPSRRDPIADWLDLFLRMLSLSKSESVAVRDELEDHLRSRVDDLLITGSSEHDAVLQAVGELGETAELARRFKQASHPSRRRTIMSTALIAIAGSALTLGAFTAFSPPSNVATLAGASGGAAPIVAFAPPPGVVAPFDERLKKYDISVFFAEDLEGQWGRMTPDRRIENITHTIMSLVSPDSWEFVGGEDASFAVTGNTMFITAPMETHEGVDWVLDTLVTDLNTEREAYAAAQAERMANAHERERAWEQTLLDNYAEGQAQRRQQIEDLRAQYEELKQAYIDVTRMQVIRELEDEDLHGLWQVNDGDERHQLMMELAETRARGAETELRYDDVRSRLSRVSSMLLDLEMAEYGRTAPAGSYPSRASARAPFDDSDSDSIKRRRTALQEAVDKGTLTQERADEMMERAMANEAQGRDR